MFACWSHLHFIPGSKGRVVLVQGASFKAVSLKCIWAIRKASLKAAYLRQMDTGLQDKVENRGRKQSSHSLHRIR